MADRVPESSTVAEETAEAGPFTGLRRVGKQIRREGAASGCISCGMTIPSALTWAHIHPNHGENLERVVRLCWTCHRLYDHGIIETAEILKAEGCWISGFRPRAAEWFRFLTDEVQAGRRKPKPELQHKGAAIRAGQKIRRKNAAMKAVATRKRNALQAPN